MRVQSVKPMKTAKIGYVILSVLFCVLGILFILFPEQAASVLGIVTGILMLLFGIVKLIGYFSRDLYRLAFQFDLAFGILLFILGIILLFQPGNVLSFICIVFGLLLLADGLFKIQTALDARAFGLPLWWVIFLFAVLAGIFGLCLFLRPSESSRVLMILVGISMLLEGILNICTVLTAVKIIRHQKPDHVDLYIYENGKD